MAISDLDYADDSDVALIRRTRTGDADAFGILHRRHAGSARALAWRMSRSASDADDLVSEGFARVLSALQRGSGPEVAFRPYLLSTIRRLAYDRTDRERREAPVEYDLDEPTTATDDPVVAGFEKDTAAAAFASLPERWRLVLWHTEVEGQKPAEVAQLLGIKPNAVAALAYRAREGLRQAYLTHHTTALPSSDHECRLTNDRLAAYIRGGLAAGHEERVRRHLDDCDECRAAYLELANVNTALRGLVGLALLGPLAGAYLSEVAAPTVPPAAATAGRAAKAGKATAVVGATGVLASPTTAAVSALARRQARMAVGIAAAVVALAAVAGWFASRPDTQTVGLAKDVSDQSAPTPPDGSPERASIPISSGSTELPSDPQAPYVTTTVPSSSGTDRPGGLDGSGRSSRSSDPLGPGLGSSGGGSAVTPTTTLPGDRQVEQPFTPVTPTTTTTTTVPPPSEPPIPPEPPAPAAALRVSSSGAGELVEGRSGSLVAYVTNDGEGASDDVQLDLDVTPLLRRGLPHQAGWSCAATGASTLRCTSSGLAPGAIRSLFVPVSVPGASTGLDVTPAGTAAGGNATSAPSTVQAPLVVKATGLAARFATIDHGDVIVTGNGLVTCPEGAFECADARAGTATGFDGVNPYTNNNAHVMVEINQDPSLGTTNSSSAPLDVPAGAEVTSATLVYGADTALGTGGAAADPGLRDQVVVRAPDGSRHDLVAERVDAIGTSYQGVVDVTDLVRAEGGGSWTVGGIPIGTGKGRHAGWSLAVVLSDPSRPLRSLVVLDGLNEVDVDESVELSVGGFVGPRTAAPGSAILRAVAYEGDQGTSGDSLSYVAGGDACPEADGASNVFDSRAEVPGRLPGHVNLLGFDIDSFDVSEQMAAGSTTGTICLSTSNDRYLPGLVTFAVEQ